MKLSDTIVAEIEGGIKSYVPPYPERAKHRRSLFELFRIYRSSLLGIFDEEDYHRRYARLRILRRELILCNTPDMIQKTLQVQHEIFQQKTAQLEQALKPLIGDGLFISNGDLWRERRDAVAPLVHPGHMGVFAPIMCETIDEWTHAWTARGDGAEVDVIAEMAELTSEVISRTIFGQRLGRGLTSELVTSFKEYLKQVYQTDMLSMLGFPDWFPRVYRGRIGRSTRRIHAVIDRIIHEHNRGLSLDSERNVIIDQLFKAKTRSGCPFSKRAVRNEAVNLFLAGHETTANTLAWMWLNLSQSPRVLEKLHAELDSVLGGRPPVYEDIGQLRYTRYVIEETLRLYPPATFLARRAGRDGVIEGEPFRKGDILFIVPWLLHRNPNVWSHADSFIPERFDPDIAPRPNKYAYIPFSIGPRTCPGMVFGLTESILVLATIAQRFDLRLKSGHQVEIFSRFTVRPGDSLPMTLHTRPAPG